MKNKKRQRYTSLTKNGDKEKSFDKVVLNKALKDLHKNNKKHKQETDKMFESLFETSQELWLLS